MNVCIQLGCAFWRAKPKYTSYLRDASEAHVWGKVLFGRDQHSAAAISTANLDVKVEVCIVPIDTS